MCTVPLESVAGACQIESNMISGFFQGISLGIRMDQVLFPSAAVRWGAKGSEKRPTVTQEELQKHSSEEVGRECCAMLSFGIELPYGQSHGNVLLPLFI